MDATNPIKTTRTKSGGASVSAVFRRKPIRMKTTERLIQVLLTVQVFLLGSADFMCCGFTHSLADGRTSHAVLSRGDPVRDRLARHGSYYFN